MAHVNRGAQLYPLGQRVARPEHVLNAMIDEVPDHRTLWGRLIDLVENDPAGREITAAAIRAADYGLDPTNESDLIRVIAAGRRMHKQRVEQQVAIDRACDAARERYLAGEVDRRAEQERRQSERERADAEREAAKAAALAERKRELGDASIKRVGRHPSVVYYVQLGSLVKIGTTVNAANRLPGINPQVILGLEFGGRRVEAQRHGQFASLRRHGEWFEAETDLLEHAAALREPFEAAARCTLEQWLEIHLPAGWNARTGRPAS